MFEKHIIQFSENLEGLRDFVEMVSDFLEQKEKDELSEDPIGFIPWILALSELDTDLFELDEDKKEKFKTLFGAKVEIEVVEETGMKNKKTPIY